MKALTLTQPWATLMALGLKTIETRSWYTNYRGPLAIHAAKGFPRWARKLADDAFYSDLALYLGEGKHSNALPRGVVVGICELINVIRTEDIDSMEILTDREREYGDYSAGRYGWVTKGMMPLSPPVAAMGALGVWEWRGHVS